MKKNLSKIMMLLLVIGLFVLSMYIDVPQDINKYARSVIADSKMDATCDTSSRLTGEGEVRYVTGDSLRIRTGPGTNYDIVTSYDSCTLVRVYCTSGNWARVSKTSSFWMHTDYLSENVPSKCSNVTQTTTKTITFQLSSATYLPAAGMDKMYSNKEGRVRFNLSNVTNLADDDDNLIQVSVALNGQATSNFDITKSYNGGSGSITLTQNNVNMPAGKYTVRVTIGENTVQRDFTIVGKYYNFSINDDASFGTPGEKCTGWFNKVCTQSDTFSSNIENVWIVEINPLVDATNYDAFEYTITLDGKDASKYFEVERLDDYRWQITNNTKRSRPKSGNYVFTLIYQDTSYSTARGEITDTYNFSIGAMYYEFERDSILSGSYRYLIEKRQTTYTISITRREKIGEETTYITFTEDGTEYEMYEQEFRSIYSDLDLILVNYDDDGYLIYIYSAECIVTGLTATTATYLDATETSITVDLATFDAKFPGLRAQMASAGYTSDASGRLIYTTSGIKTVTTRTLETKKRNIFAETGGQFNFVYNYSYLDQEDFLDAEVYIQKDDGKRYDESDGFTFTWGEITENTVTMHLDYRGDSIDYVGDYTIYIRLNEDALIEVPFGLYDGEIDFYLTAIADHHYGTNDPLDTGNPPGNKDYEWYIGFYLMKAGQQLDKISARMITVDIYDHRADLDENGKLYFYEQVDYEVYLKNMLNDTITYEVREGDATTATERTESYETFKEKYYQVAELVDDGMYTFDSTTGDLLPEDNYELHIERFYFEVGMPDNLVVFRDSAGVRHEMELADFRIQYPDMFGYLQTRLFFDPDGYIIHGAVMGNYRITEKDGKPIEGKEVSDMFSIPEFDPDADVDKAIKILPDPEVPAGTYHVYVNYDNIQGVGYINNSDEPVITKEQFPEMWNQNIHMTSIMYDDPVYGITINDPIYSNVGNENEKIYQNIEGTAHFVMDFQFIHDHTGLSYKVTDANGNDASSYFDVISSFDPRSRNYNVEDPYITITTIPGQAPTGTYTLSVDYIKDGISAPTATKTFEISGKYYGLEVEDNEVEFIRNYSETKSILVKATYTDDATNIVPEIERIVTGGNAKLTRDDASMSFKDALGNTFFTYEVSVYDHYYPDDPNAVLYELLLTNESNVALQDEYLVTFTYAEGNNDVATATKQIEVGPEQYHFTIGKESAEATNEGMFLYFDIETEFIEQRQLSNFNYVIYMYDFANKVQVDVSTKGTGRQLFEITPIWEDEGGPNYKGRIQIKFLEHVDLSGSYYIEASIENTVREAAISNLRNLFNWQIASHTIGSIYHGVNFAGDEETIQLDTIYTNLEEATIDLTLETVYQSDVSWTVNKSCISTNLDETCGPSGVNYNYAFDDNGNNSGETNHLVLTMKQGLEESRKLQSGEYSLVLYYGNDNYRFVNFEVKSEYADIQIGDPNISSIVDVNADGTNVTAPGLYRNLTGYINLGLTLRGFAYDYNLLTLEITNAAGTDVTSSFFVNSSDFAETKILAVGYDAKSNLAAGDYLLTLKYATQEEVISASHTFEIKEGYFNLSISDPVYTPDTLYPNLEDGGEAKFIVKTENIKNVLFEAGTNNDTANTEKHVIASNTTITNMEGNNVTNQFTITAANNSNSVLDSTFDLNVTYEQNAIEPGYYILTTYYELYNYVVRREQEFMVGDYVKDLKITKTEIISPTNDGRMHKNISGIYRVHYTTAFDLISEYFNISIHNSEGTDVSEYFEITDYGTHVDFSYQATEPFIDSGDYTIIMTYQEDSSVEAFITSTNVHMYATYKDITLKDLVASADNIYADLPDQYYTFKVESAAMSTEDRDNLIFKIFDEDDNLVYSELSTDNITPQFGIINSLNTDDGVVRIAIEAFKARVGEYRIVAYLEDEDGEYNFSNALPFTIDYTYYKITLSNSSYINPVVTYGDDTIYDKDGADMYFKFTSTYPSASNPKYSIKLYDGLTFYREYEVDHETLTDDGIRYFVIQALSGEIDANTYNFAVCLNGLPYVWLTEEIGEYIYATSAKINIGGTLLGEGESTNVYVGTTLDLSVQVEPANATNQVFTFTSADPGILTIDSKTNKLTINSLGTTELIAKNNDLTIKVTIVADLRLGSTRYRVDYTNYQIYVDIMTTSSLTKDQFMRNLTGVASNYKLYDYSGKDVTSTVKNMATGMRLENSKETYTVIIIGDLNRDGTINVYDVSMLYAHVRGTRKITDKNVLKAADIRKINSINVYDVSKLYSFVRGTGSSL